MRSEFFLVRERPGSFRKSSIGYGSVRTLLAAVERFVEYDNAPVVAYQVIDGMPVKLITVRPGNATGGTR